MLQKVKSKDPIQISSVQLRICSTYIHFGINLYQIKTHFIKQNEGLIFHRMNCCAS